VVHHIDGDKENNHPDNLEIISSAEHSRLHALEGASDPVQLRCPVCFDGFALKPHEHRRRAKNAEAVCCSRSCAVTLAHRNR
jgi:hypothetical protein